MEQNCNGAMDTAYVYGTDRLSLDRFDGSTGYYLYDPKGSVTGITNSDGQICRSYRYGAFGEITYGAPQYENICAYNGESYNQNVGSLYLRARYYNVSTGAFFTEDTYLGNIGEPLTLNRYVYCVGNPVNYVDPSGKYTAAQGREAHEALQNYVKSEYDQAEIEYRITGYAYSATGVGRADIVFFTPTGIEVYEIKPAWQAFVPDDKIKPYSGRMQRKEYMRALRNGGQRVSEYGTTFNPNGYVLEIDDPEYSYARYFTLPDQPGMIYYRLIKKPPKDPKLLPVLKKIEEAKEHSVYAVGCVLQPVRIGGNPNINIDLPELQWAWQADVGGAMYYLFPGIGELLKFAVPALAW